MKPCGSQLFFLLWVDCAGVKLWHCESPGTAELVAGQCPNPPLLSIAAEVGWHLISTFNSKGSAEVFWKRSDWFGSSLGAVQLFKGEEWNCPIPLKQDDCMVATTNLRAEAAPLSCSLRVAEAPLPVLQILPCCAGALGLADSSGRKVQGESPTTVGRPTSESCHLSVGQSQPSLSRKSGAFTGRGSVVVPCLGKFHWKFRLLLQDTNMVYRILETELSVAREIFEVTK